MEYKEFAKYYDIFYQKKDYNKEVNFLMNFIKKGDIVIDLGCGTGIHASLINNYGALVDGLDLSSEMLDIAKTRLNTNLFNQSILDINIDRKYDVAISMFAVINHLKNLDELKICLSNIKKILDDNGIIIIDLHNPQSSCSKTDQYGDIKRIMEWNFNKEERIENSSIYFEINNTKYESSHVFRIFSIDEVKDACNSVDLKVIGIYENYDINKPGSELSKNLQFLISKND